ncbi:MAG: molybdopterin molybdenumtransferase [Actinobacteria bacterium HGW-Actinobacteria-4]|nr:MAG: molybdopterin molybdenumtransferase [Actinobacteria bacterium HGW-Actinobacteria-4]
MRTVEQHVAAALALVAPTDEVTVSWSTAQDLVLAADVRSLIDIPSWDNSAMDGFAVRAADVSDATTTSPVVLRVIADLPAGTSERPLIGPGQAARIMTGAPLPEGADAVVPVERTHGLADTVEITWTPALGAHIRRRAEDVSVGQPVLAAGQLLGPAQLAAAVAAGHSQLRVHRRPRVAILATGNELTPPGEPLAFGCIYDSNSVLLAAAVKGAGAEPVQVRTVGDDLADLSTALGQLRDVDAAITSGGISMGNKDVVKELLQGDRFEFVEVALQPGRPQGLGTLKSGIPLFALPGNPVSSLVSFTLFCLPAIRKLRGVSPAQPTTRVGVIGAGWETPAGRAQAMPVVWDYEPDVPELVNVRPATDGGSGSHLVTRLAVATGFAMIDADTARVKPGDRVQIMEMPS